MDLSTVLRNEAVTDGTTLGKPVIELKGFTKHYGDVRAVQDLDLVAVSEYPPGDFIEAVDTKFYDCRAVVIARNFLCTVPFYLGDIISYFRQEMQLDMVDSAFRHH